MKKLMLAAVALALLSLPAFADSAVSPAVGVIKVEVPAGLSLMSVPFETGDGGTHTLDSIFGNSLSDGSQVIIFEPGVGYKTYSFYEGYGWYFGDSPAGETVLERGVGFWVRNKGMASVAIFMAGRVPVSEKNIAIPAGYSIVSFAFPLDLEVDQLEGLTPVDGDRILAFENGAYITHNYYEGFGWYNGDSPSDFKFEPGKSAWYFRRSSNTYWLQALPPNAQP